MESAEDYAEVFAHFAAQEVPAESCYAYAPVFPCRVNGLSTVVKQTRSVPENAAKMAAWTTALATAGIGVVAPVDAGVANPVLIGERHWVAYPFIDGSRYTGDIEQITAAGDLLGRVHAAEVEALPPDFAWPTPDADSVAEDVAGLKALGEHHDAAVLERLCALVSRFGEEILPVIREAGLPHAGAVMDYKANNLVYADGKPVLIDPDNGDRAPRLFDLALAALQFHIEHAEAPARMFTTAEWRAFVEGYSAHVTLTPAERELWPLAFEYMLSEWGVWSIIDSDMQDQRERDFMRDMAAATVERFPLV